ncbi:CGNR zinc finger domain-containing protein [Streptomyces sp. NPDC001068]|uniref:CGNR zinc finger domain-containing protein n=1 Tax=Streptomyces sp. NPDC001068 TaxID=3364544 RepID=UPI0036802E17
MDTRAPLMGEPLPVELMNTIWADRHGRYDALRDPGGVEAWLSSVCPRTDLMTADDLDGLAAADLDRLGDRLISLRDALRGLAAEVTQEPRPEAASEIPDLSTAVHVLNEAAGRTPHWPVLCWSPGAEPSRRRYTSGEAASAVLSAIAEEAVIFFSQDSRHQLRACLAPSCVLYFLKNHPRREWCSTSCGNRARSARHYQRHHRSTA